VKTFTSLFFLILLISGCAATITTQPQWAAPVGYANQFDSIWPKHKNIKHLFDPQTGSNGDAYVITEGYIVTNKNDTLRGYIKISPTVYVYEPDQSIAFLPLNKTDSKDIKNIEMSQTTLVRTIPGKNDTIDYIPLPTASFDSTLWRVLATKDNIKICYQYSLYKVFDYTNNVLDKDYDRSLVLVTKTGAVKSIYPSGFMNFHFNDINYSLLKFINKKYKQHFTINSFKTANAMVDYILDKENAKETSVKQNK
jgi:hypothetical protein